MAADDLSAEKAAWWVRLGCLIVGHTRRPLSLPGGSRLVFAGPCARCGR